MCWTRGLWPPSSAPSGASRSTEQTARLGISVRNQPVKGPLYWQPLHMATPWGEHWGEDVLPLWRRPGARPGGGLWALGPCAKPLGRGVMRDLVCSLKVLFGPCAVLCVACRYVTVEALFPGLLACRRNGTVVILLIYVNNITLPKN